MISAISNFAIKFVIDFGQKGEGNYGISIESDQIDLNKTLLYVS